MLPDMDTCCEISASNKRLLDFKLPTAKQRKVVELSQSNTLVVDDEESGSDHYKEFLTVVDKNTLTVDQNRAQTKKLVIPAVDSSLATQNRAMDETLQGANHRNHSRSSSPSFALNSQLPDVQLEQKPFLLSNIYSAGRSIRNEDDRFRFDLRHRADDLDVKSSTYESIPVEEFGAALLRGMGWKEDDRKPEPTRAHNPFTVPVHGNRQGLGAQFLTLNTDTNANASNGLQQRYRPKFSIGSFVLVNRGEHTGKRAVVNTVTGVPGLNDIKASLEDTNESVTVSKDDVRLLSVEDIEENPLRYGSDRNSARHVRNLDSTNCESFGSSNIRPSAVNSKHTSRPKHDRLHNKDDSSTSGWLVVGIRVKVISKKMNSDTLHLYLEKGTVVDIPAKNTATLRLDNGKIIENVKAKYLETVLPDVGGLCLILFGENKGETAKLLEKKREKERAVIELTDSLQILEVSMNSIASAVM